MQRVLFARLLLQDAQLVLLDEPFTAIDRAGVVALEHLLMQRAQDGGAVVVTTHHDLQAPALNRITLGGGHGH